LDAAKEKEEEEEELPISLEDIIVDPFCKIQVLQVFFSMRRERIIPHIFLFRKAFFRTPTHLGGAHIKKDEINR